MTNKAIYLLHPPDYYGNAFTPADTNPKKLYSHIFYQFPVAIIVPEEITKATPTPEDFLQLKNEIGLTALIIIDSTKLPPKINGALIQIKDHINISGRNPLIGKTPINNLPQFPDMSECYRKTDINLPAMGVTTAGPGRFYNVQEKFPEQIISEAAALIALSAAYSGTEVIGVGWDKSRDKDGQKLKNWVEINFPDLYLQKT